MWSFVQYKLNNLVGLFAISIIIKGINIRNNTINGLDIKIVNNSIVD